MFNLVFGLGGQELLVIGLIILVFFGGKKIPELMRGLGSGIREFNNAKNNIEAEVKENMREIDSQKEKTS
ncbi:MAG: twin-arginine translocase TatA/TatE family subunit [Saprospiraceae bacterium]